MTRRCVQQHPSERKESPALELTCQPKTDIAPRPNVALFVGIFILYLFVVLAHSLAMTPLSKINSAPVCFACANCTAPTTTTIACSATPTCPSVAEASGSDVKPRTVPSCSAADATCWSTTSHRNLAVAERQIAFAQRTGLTFLEADGMDAPDSVPARWDLVVLLSEPEVVRTVAERWHPVYGMAGTVVTVTRAAQRIWQRGGILPGHCRLLITETNTTHIDLPSNDKGFFEPTSLEDVLNLGLLAHRVKSTLALRSLSLQSVKPAEAEHALRQLLEPLFLLAFLPYTECLRGGVSLSVVAPGKIQVPFFGVDFSYRSDFVRDGHAIRIKTDFVPTRLLGQLRDANLCAPLIRTLF